MTNVDTPVPHTEAARQLLENLRAMQATIDGFGIPPAPLDRQSRPRGHRLLPDGMFASLAVALEASQPFAAATDLTPGEIRDMLRYGEAYLPVADELERFARGIRYLVGMRRSKVGRKASSAYRVGQAMNLLADDALLVPEVESMKRAIKDRRRRKDSTTPSEPGPQSSGSP